MTALHLASKYNAPDIASLLIWKGADFDAFNDVRIAFHPNQKSICALPRLQHPLLFEYILCTVSNEPFNFVSLA